MFEGEEIVSTHRVVTRPILKRLNAKAIRLKLNRTMRPDRIARLSAHQVFPITQAALHNDDHLRCRIILNEEGHAAELDISLDDFNALPTVTVP
jgi:hypothetical protein